MYQAPILSTLHVLSGSNVITVQEEILLLCPFYKWANGGTERFVSPRLPADKWQRRNS